MADQAYHIEIITPESVVFSGDVDTVEIPGEAGEFQVLGDHTPFLTGVKSGPVYISIAGSKTIVSVSGGFCEVLSEKTVILAQAAELADDIDTERAGAARKRAEERLESNADDIDTDRAKAALARAMNRLNVAEMLEEA